MYFYSVNYSLFKMFLLLLYKLAVIRYNWAASWQNQHSAFATSMDHDQPAHPRSLIRIHAVPLHTLLQVEKLKANSMDPDQTARMRRVVWIHAGCKCTMLILSWCGSYDHFVLYSKCQISEDWIFRSAFVSFW
jgi:hypothetical protein